MLKNRVRKCMTVLMVMSLLSLSGKQEVLGGGNWPPTGVGRGESSLGIEEYSRKEDYTGWLHVTVRVVDQERKPVEGMYITLRKADGSGEAGHGPAINGAEDYKTDEKGELLFRIFPSPIEYNVSVPKQDKWEGKEDGPHVIEEDFQTIEVVVEEVKTDNDEEDNGGGDNGGGDNGGGDNGGGDNGGGDNNGGDNNGGDNNGGDNNGGDNNGGDNNGGGNNGGNNGGGNNGGGNSNSGNVTEEKPETEAPTEESTETPTEEAAEESTGEDENNRPGNNGNQGNNQEDSLEDDVAEPEEVVLPEEPSEDGDREVMVPGPDKQMDTGDDVLVIPDLGNNQENNSSVDPDGNIKLPDGGVIIFQTDPDKGDVMIKVPEGTKVEQDGTIHLPDGGNKELMLPGKDAHLETTDDVWLRPHKGGNGKDNSVLHRDGSVLLVDGGWVTYMEDGSELEVPKGTIVLADGTIIYLTSGGVSRIPAADCGVHWAETSGILFVVLFGLWRLKQLDGYLGINQKSRNKKEVTEEDENRGE